MIVMYDTVDVFTVPDNPPAVAGYVGGHWPTYNGLVARFPHAHHLSIAVFASEDAECLDVENGDATPAEAPGWVWRQLARGVHRPCLYASLSVMPGILLNCYNSGLKRSQLRVWTAHYTYSPHIEPGSDATQWTDVALGRNLDESLCLDSFFSVIPTPPPPPKPPEDTEMIVASRMSDGRVELFVENKDGEIFHTWQLKADQGGGWSGAQAGKRNAGWYSLGTPGK